VAGGFPKALLPYIDILNGTGNPREEHRNRVRCRLQCRMLTDNQGARLNQRCHRSSLISATRAHSLHLLQGESHGPAELNPQISRKCRDACLSKHLDGLRRKSPLLNYHQKKGPDFAEGRTALRISSNHNRASLQTSKQAIRIRYASGFQQTPPDHAEIAVFGAILVPV